MGRALRAFSQQSGNVGSDTIREALRAAEKDSKIKAVVIRIDSPGGSALASEAMWQAVRRVAKTKPVFISVGSMAASGGYYLASQRRLYFRRPDGDRRLDRRRRRQICLQRSFRKARPKHRVIYSRQKRRPFQLRASNGPTSSAQQVTNWMRETYNQFTQRVMTTRKGKIKDIDSVARGRIFVADRAKELGMVDRDRRNPGRHRLCGQAGESGHRRI